MVVPFRLRLNIIKRKNLIDFGGSRSKGGVWRGEGRSETLIWFDFVAMAP